MNKEKVVVIIPTYNEEFVIKNTIEKVFEHFETIQNFDCQLLIFDSASTDRTANIVKRLQLSNDKLHFESEEKKTGLGSAYLQAMHYALKVMHADIIIEFDADLSHQPKYIAPILEKMNNYDVVVGSRYVKGGSIPDDWGWQRKLFSRLGNLISRSLLTPKYKDFTSGFRATRTQLLKAVLPTQFISSNYGYKLELFWLLHKNKAKIIEYPIDFIDRTQGQSKLPKNSIADSLQVLLRLRFNELKRYLKMCTVGLTGVAVQFISYNLLRNYLTPTHAVKIAILFAIINNFILNNRFTFKRLTSDENKITVKMFALFSAYSIFQIYLQSAWLNLGINYYGTGYIIENLILATGVVLGSVINYIVYTRIVWRHIKYK